MMLELSYLGLLPIPVLMALVGSILVSVLVFIQSCLDVLREPGHTPELYYRQSSLNDHVLAKCKMKDRIFQPSFWLRSAHVQTVLPVILPRPDVTFEREYLQMMDKGVVALDWVMTPHVKVRRKTPILLVIPSMTEGAVSMSNVCSQAVSRGMKPVVFNRRGFGDSCLTTPKLASSGDPSDLRQVVIYIKQRLPKSPLAAMACGSGCGLLLSYLGEFGSSALLSVAVCISPSFDEPARFSSKFRSSYDFLLLLKLKSIICQHLPALLPVIDADRLFSSWTFEQLNQTVFSPFCGSGGGGINNHHNTSNNNIMTSSGTSSTIGVDQYWEINNSMRDVDDIAVPIMCITSLDDPINPSSDIPFDLFKCYPNFLLIVTDRGGHCGFLEGFPPCSWSDALTLDYAEAVIEFTTKSLPPSSLSSSQQRHSLQPLPSLPTLFRKPGSAPNLRSSGHHSSNLNSSRNSGIFSHGHRHSSDGGNYKRRSGGGSRSYSLQPSPLGATEESGNSSFRRDSNGSGGSSSGGGSTQSINSKVNGGGAILLRRHSSLTTKPKMQRFTL